MRKSSRGVSLKLLVDLENALVHAYLALHLIQQLKIK